jgi:hypothetical protein
LNARRQQRRFQGDRAVGRCHPASGFVKAGKGLFEFRDLRAVTAPRAALEHLDQGGFLTFVELRPSREGPLPDRLAAQNRQSCHVSAPPGLEIKLDMDGLLE